MSPAVYLAFVCRLEAVMMSESGKRVVRRLRHTETPCFSYWEEYFLQILVSENDEHFQDSSAFPVREEKRKKMIKDPKKIESCCLGQKRLLGI